jgi:rhodanese-related sulfurtransferase
MTIREITPTELQQLLSDENPPILIDVREEGEAAICAIDGSILIPMNTLPQRLQELPRDRQVALYCHHG